jgi:hypothetical protein
VKHFIVTIEGAGWEDVHVVEIPRQPAEGDPIETQYGTCIVIRVESLPNNEKHDGKIVCRLP